MEKDKAKKIKGEIDEFLKEREAEKEEAVSEERKALVKEVGVVLQDFLTKFANEISKGEKNKQQSETQGRVFLTEQTGFLNKLKEGIENFIKRLEEREEKPREVIVKNQQKIEIPAFPKEIKVNNLPKSETNLVVGAIRALGERLKAVGQVFITNKNPEEAIPVRLVDKSAKKFYDAIMQYLGGPGISTTAIEEKLDAINTLIGDSLQDYIISDKDDDASPNYFGFLKKDGSWYIMKETVSAGADTYRYAKGTTDYTTNWTGRVGLTYGYFNDIF